VRDAGYGLVARSFFIGFFAAVQQDAQVEDAHGQAAQAEQASAQLVPHEDEQQDHVCFVSSIPSESVLMLLLSGTCGSRIS
jgi:hypothetical protein